MFKLRLCSSDLDLGHPRNVNNQCFWGLYSTVLPVYCLPRTSVITTCRERRYATFVLSVLLKWLVSVAIGSVSLPA